MPGGSPRDNLKKKKSTPTVQEFFPGSPVRGKEEDKEGQLLWVARTKLLLSHGADASLKLRLFNLMPGYLTRTTRCTHEVSALQISRMEHPSRRANGYNRSQWEESGYQTPQKQREVEEILMQNCANEAERNIGVPVCERRDFYGSCFAVLVNVDGIMSHVSGVSLPELLWVFRDFPKRMDHLANDGEDGIPWNVYRCPVRRFNLE